MSRVRRRSVYAYRVRDLRDGYVKIGYVGKTARQPMWRDKEHRLGGYGTPAKVWAGQIIGDMDIVWSADCGPLRAGLMEVWYIWRLKPLFNVEWNRSNTARITPWVARSLYDRPQGVRYE